MLPAASELAGLPLAPPPGDLAGAPSSVFLQLLFLTGEIPGGLEESETATEEALQEHAPSDSEVNPVMVADAVIRSMLRLGETPPLVPSSSHASVADAPEQRAATVGVRKTEQSLPQKAPVAFELRLTPHRHATDEDSGGSGARQDAEEPFRQALKNVLSHSREDATPAAVQPLAHAQTALGAAPPVTTPQPTPAPFETKIDVPQSPGAAPVVEDPQPVPRTASAQEIAVRVSAPDQPDVDLHVAQRGGEIKVAVRASDPVLRTSLHEDLGALVTKLDQAGFRAESITTQEFRQDSQDANSGQRNSHPGDSGPGQQQHQRQRRSSATPLEQWLETVEDNHDNRRN